MARVCLLPNEVTPRKIIHVDMDAFFAAIEQRDDPRLRGRPVAVGGSARRGVVAAASYEARVFGIHSAMPTAEALRRCPHLIVVGGRFEAYRTVSQQVRRIFHRYTDLVEPLSLDEAFLDVTAPKQGPPSATRIAEQIRREIFEETGLTASAGVGPGKFIAKVACGMNKPDGLTVVTPAEAEAFVAGLRVEDFYGVGPATAGRMHRLGLYTGADLRACSAAFLAQHFGKTGGHFWRIARALDDRPVRPFRQRKSVGAERTYHFDLRTPRQMQASLYDLAQRVAERLDHHRLAGRTLTLKVKFSDFQVQTRAHTCSAPLTVADELHVLGIHLLEAAPLPRPVRLLGLSLSGLHTAGSTPGVQLRLAL